MRSEQTQRKPPPWIHGSGEMWFRKRGGAKVPGPECISSGGFKKGPMSPVGFAALMESMGAGELDQGDLVAQ